MNTIEPVHPGDELVVTLRHAAQRIIDRRNLQDLDATLSDLVSAAVAMVPGAVGGGISFTRQGTVHSSHATHPQIGHLDRRQSALGEGPCLTAAEEPPDDGAVLVVDLAGADSVRWPRFAPEAVETGFRSMLSTHLGTRSGGPRAALNLYATEPNTFDAQARVTAGLFAIQASAVLHGAEEARRLRDAIDSRDVIGQAKGILMERFSLDSTEAFEMLVTSSQETNIKLVDVARWLAGETEEQYGGRTEPGGG